MQLFFVWSRNAPGEERCVTTHRTAAKETTLKLTGRMMLKDVSWKSEKYRSLDKNVFVQIESFAVSVC